MAGKRDDRSQLSIEELEAELLREVSSGKKKNKAGGIIVSTIAIMAVIAAFSLAAAMIWFPVFRTFGSSMSPTIVDGSILIASKDAEFKNGDIIAFYYNDKVLIKRVIAGEGETVELDADGNVSVNGKPLSEPYIQEKSYGENKVTDIEFPFTVGEERWFVMGDRRRTSMDSRNSLIGCVSREQIIGKVVFCIWPLDNFGILK